MKNLKLKSKGQVMILSVVMISGAVLSATAAVGILMIYELRHAGNAINSAEAIFAADAGVECALMKHKEDEPVLDCNDSGAPVELSNGATFEVFEVTDTCGVIGARSLGKSNQVARSFEAFFTTCP